MKSKNEASGISIVIILVCIILAVVGATSLRTILAHINPWQAAAYAIVAGIFIALAVVILNAILTFFRNE